MGGHSRNMPGCGVGVKDVSFGRFSPFRLSYFKIGFGKFDVFLRNCFFNGSGQVADTAPNLRICGPSGDILSLGLQGRGVTHGFFIHLLGFLVNLRDPILAIDPKPVNMINNIDNHIL